MPSEIAAQADDRDLNYPPSSIRAIQNTENLTWIIVGAFFGFVFLAFILLYPVYRLLKKEAERNKEE